jgi:hypothetical protein
MVDRWPREKHGGPDDINGLGAEVVDAAQDARRGWVAGVDGD